MIILNKGTTKTMVIILIFLSLLVISVVSSIVFVAMLIMTIPVVVCTIKLFIEMIIGKKSWTKKNKRELIMGIIVSIALINASVKIITKLVGV